MFESFILVKEMCTVRQTTVTHDYITQTQSLTAAVVYNSENWERLGQNLEN